MLMTLDGFFMCLSWTRAACAGNTRLEAYQAMASSPLAGLK